LRTLWKGETRQVSEGSKLGYTIQDFKKRGKRRLHASSRGRKAAWFGGEGGGELGKKKGERGHTGPLDFLEFLCLVEGGKEKTREGGKKDRSNR